MKFKHIIVICLRFLNDSVDESVNEKSHQKLGLRSLENFSADSSLVIPKDDNNRGL